MSIFQYQSRAIIDRYSARRTLDEAGNCNQGEFVNRGQVRHGCSCSSAFRFVSAVFKRTAATLKTWFFPLNWGFILVSLSPAMRKVSSRKQKQLPVVFKNKTPQSTNKTENKKDTKRQAQLGNIPFISLFIVH